MADPGIGRSHPNGQPDAGLVMGACHSIPCWQDAIAFLIRTQAKFLSDGAKRGFEESVIGRVLLGRAGSGGPLRSSFSRTKPLTSPAGNMPSMAA